MTRITITALTMVTMLSQPLYADQPSTMVEALTEIQNTVDDVMIQLMAQGVQTSQDGSVLAVTTSPRPQPRPENLVPQEME